MKRNAMTSVSADKQTWQKYRLLISSPCQNMVRCAGPSVFGHDHASKVVGFWPMDRVEIDAYDNWRRL